MNLLFGNEQPDQPYCMSTARERPVFFNLVGLQCVVGSVSGLVDLLVFGCDTVSA